MMSYYRHSGVEEVTVTTTMNAVGCSYAENFLVNLNNKYKLQFSACVHVFVCSETGLPCMNSINH